MKKLLTTVGTIVIFGLTSVVAFANIIPAEISNALAIPTSPADQTTVTPSDTGVYFGIEGGYGLTNWNDQAPFYKTSQDNGIVGRIFLGYDINKYFATEFGYSHFFNKAKQEDKTNSKSYAEYKTQGFDLLGKGKLPVTDKFNLYAKLGVSYLMCTANSHGDNDPTWDNIKSPKKFNVAYGAGADYSITSHITANIGWLHYRGNSKWDDSGDFLPDTDAFMAGLRYRFDL